MNTTTLVTALALAALGTTAAHAATPPLQTSASLPLQDATITASYNGDAAGMLGLDHWFTAAPGANTSALDPTGTGVEFLTADFLFGIDFSAGGALTVFANNPIPSGAYSMRFDFGSSLAAPISAFTWIGASGAAGVPGLSIVDAHTIALDLGGVTWSEFGSLTAQVTTAVPEPSGAAMLLGGLGGLGSLALARRRRQPRH